MSKHHRKLSAKDLRAILRNQKRYTFPMSRKLGMSVDVETLASFSALNLEAVQVRK